MVGALAGDIIGSIYERNNIRNEEFPLFKNKSFFTDDSVLTVALADSILNNVGYDIKLKEYFQKYPNAGYGLSFRIWATIKNTPAYNSWGNGSAMRVSPIGWAYSTLEEVQEQAKISAAFTHNHPEGLKGAVSVASAIFLARQDCSKPELKKYIEKNFSYSLKFNLKTLQKNYKFNESCQETVPQAIYAFLISDSFEDSIRKAISIGGDSDTLACINGSIAEAFYKGVPKNIEKEVYKRLSKPLADVTKC